MQIEIFSYIDPLSVFALFADESHAVLLDSAATNDKKSRYSYIAIDPFSIIECRGKRVTLNGEQSTLDPFALLKQELKKYACDMSNVPVPFAGGAIGYFGYELGGWLETLPIPRHDELDLPSMIVGFYDFVLAFDNTERKAWIISSGWPETSPEQRENRARERAQKFKKIIEHASQPQKEINWKERGTWIAELKRDEIEKRIGRIIEYIYAGDIFQANFTQRFRAEMPKGLTAFMLYRRLRAANPAPFAAYLNCGKGLSVACASPERFLSVNRDKTVEAHPIKGTRPRADNSVQDRKLADQLRTSAKDRAENLMIVDLMRNDLSRVCQPGSVQVLQLCQLESFASVHHLTSVVTGKLRQENGPVDLLRASFPGGSITGAPKIRAMEIIHELESAPRDIYCGCLGWIAFDGAMDMCMTIRTLTIAGTTILAQAGGGIVADSDPAAEYEESMIKIAPLLRALTGDSM